MPGRLPQERLLEIVELQNEIGSTALELDDVIRLIVGRAQAMTGAAGAVIERADGDELVYDAASGAAEVLVGLRVRGENTLAALCIARREVIFCRDAETDARVELAAARKLGARSMLYMPLSFRGRTRAVLKVFSPNADAFGDSDVLTLSLLSGMIAAHMAHAGAFERRHDDSRHDVLTGLPNRRAFEERLGSEVARVRRHGGELSLCLLDLDGFKIVNDTLGHAVGDEVLRGVSKHLATVRGEDAAFRRGADQFAILFVETDAEGAKVAARRLALEVRADHGCGGVGISWGIAQLDGGDPATLLGDAGTELFRAKRTRRG